MVNHNDERNFIDERDYQSKQGQGNQNTQTPEEVNQGASALELGAKRTQELEAYKSKMTNRRSSKGGNTSDNFVEGKATEKLIDYFNTE